jgi:hypothetical protein
MPAGASECTETSHEPTYSKALWARQQMMDQDTLSLVIGGGGGVQLLADHQIIMWLHIQSQQQLP